MLYTSKIDGFKREAIKDFLIGCYPEMDSRIKYELRYNARALPLGQIIFLDLILLEKSEEGYRNPKMGSAAMVDVDLLN